MAWQDGARGSHEGPLFTAWEVLTAPVAPRTWRATVHLVTGGLIAALAVAVVTLLAALAAALAISVVVLAVLRFLKV